MPDPRMQEFHRLVDEQRYREARGILETEDLDRQVVEKWTIWLEELQRAERVLVGVASDKRKPHQRQQASGEIGAIFGQVIAISLAAAGVVLGTGAILTTANTVLISGLLMLAIIGGYLGWIRLARLLMPGSNGEVGIFITFGLMVYLLTSGLPFVYYFEPPVSYLLAGAALIAPIVLMTSWQVGGMVGKRLTEAIWRFLHPDAGLDEVKTD